MFSYLHDGRSSVLGLLDAQGVMVDSYRFDAFGNESGESGSAIHNPFRFNGEYTDFETGFQYLRNRFYNPVTGRFITADPFWGIHNMQDNTAAILQSGNLFMFGMHNPVRWIDPLGLWCKEIHESMTKTQMAVLAAENPELADFFFLSAHFIVQGNLAVDEPPYAAFYATFIHGDRNDNPSRHFNRATDGTDSRVDWAERYLRIATSMWLSADRAFQSGQMSIEHRNTIHNSALTLLGRGLHSIQDIEAHGDIGVGNWLAAHGPPGTGMWDADDPNFDWGNNRRQPLVPSTERVRYNTSHEHTRIYLERFFRGVGILQ